MKLEGQKKYWSAGEGAFCCLIDKKRTKFFKRSIFNIVKKNVLNIVKTICILVLERSVAVYVVYGNIVRAVIV